MFGTRDFDHEWFEVSNYDRYPIFYRASRVVTHSAAMTVPREVFRLSVRLWRWGVFFT